MKFEKFVKQMGGEGVIYNRSNGEKWLASTSVFMQIPERTTGVLAEKIATMPAAIEEILDATFSGDPAVLFDAKMPFANAGIKDCVRIFATENGQVKCPVCNNDYALIEKSDVVEIFSKYNTEEETYTAKALFVKQYTNPCDDPELIGVIFPIADEL